MMSFVLKMQECDDGGGAAAVPRRHAIHALKNDEFCIL